MISRALSCLFGIVLCLALPAGVAQAKLVTRTIQYQQDGVSLNGYLAYDDAHKGPRPGVLVVHEWWGLNDYVKGRANQLAELGYVAFAADMYGGARTTRDPNEAKEWSSAVRSQPGLMAARAKAALDVLRRQPQVDVKRVAAIGFCFGGTTVLKLAYSGESLDGVVTFHGGLIVPDENEVKHIETSFLILQGAKDPFVTPQTIDALKQSLDAAGVDWYMVTYAGAVHAFTNPDADSYGLPGARYDKKAATRSWDEMQRFFRERFGSG